jgi:WD40 repeat protein
VIAASKDNAVTVWDLNGKRFGDGVGWSIEGEHHRQRHGFDALALSADAKTLAATVAGAVQFWDAGARPGALTRTIPSDDPDMRNHSALALAADGKTLATAAYERPICVIDLTSRVPKNRLTLAIKSSPEALAFSPDSALLAVPDGGDREKPGVVRIFRAESGKEQWSITRPKSWVHTLTFAPDGRELAISWYNGPVTLLEVASRKQRAEILPGKGAPYAIAFAPNSKRLATAGQDGHVAVWEWGEKTWSTQLPGSVGAISWSPDSRHLATGNANGTVFVLRVP